MPETPFGHLSCYRTRALVGAKAIYQTVSPRTRVNKDKGKD
jgi:hypothetical protein